MDGVNHDEIVVDNYSLASYYVEMYFDNRKLSNATCFFSQQNGRFYIVTNWHVVSGKDADTLECLNCNAAIPNKLRIYLPKYIEEEGCQFSDTFFVEVDLYDGEGNKLWYELECNGKMVDVVLVPFKKETDLFFIPIEKAEDPFNENTEFQIADNIFIIGFPFGQIGGCMPIWKRASVASEPEYDMDDMPYYYADTATRSGMSGSPVILYKDRSGTVIDGKEGVSSRHLTKLVGIYSGRIGADTGNRNDAQLGRVWKTRVIKEILAIYEKS